MNITYVTYVAEIMLETGFRSAAKKSTDEANNDGQSGQRLPTWNSLNIK